MYHDLMVPLDGSEFGRYAIPWALAIAKPANARVHLVHVPMPPYGMGAVDDMLVLPEVAETQRESAEEALSDLAERLRIGTDVEFDAAIVEGTPADAVVEYAATHAVDLIVMTTHGRTGLARALLGSVSDIVVRRSRVPVLLVRPSRHPPEEREPAAVSEVLVLLDGSPAGELILDHAAELCRLTGAGCTLLHVVTPELLPTGVAVPAAMAAPHAADADERMAEAYLARQADRLRDGQVPWTTATIRHPDLAEGILEYCATHAVSLVAMTTRGTAGVDRAVLGSSTDALLRKTHLPILVASSHEVETAEAVPPPP
jgi:nucleotide-binding universal stress UspA family protein